MHSDLRRRRSIVTSRAELLALVIAFGVLLMHSVTPTDSKSMSGTHSHTAAAATIDHAAPVMTGENDCASGHQMMHPCLGITTAWPAVHAPDATVTVVATVFSTTHSGHGLESGLGRDPPWKLWERDKSVTLRV